MSSSGRRAAELHDLRVLGEALAVVVITWLLLGWTPARAITQMDGSQLVMPYVRGAVAAGPDWTQYLYRFGVIGGSEMHPFGGTVPLVQLCAALGASTTLTCNVVTWFAQVSLAAFAIVSTEALASRFTGTEVRLGAPARVVAVWLVGFAPVVGWRLGTGHENLVYGLLPFVATFALMLAAGTARITGTLLAFAAFAVANGVSGLGAQTVVYGVAFGAPLALAAIFVAPRGERWTRARLHAVLALAAGVLLVLPRIVSMIAHATSADASRGLGESTIYSYSTSSWRDWLASLPWTTAPAFASHDRGLAHEYNFPVGPLAVLLVALWPWRRARGLLVAAAASAVSAILLADHVAPLSDAILAALPPLRAFRVPARAILPVAIVLPTLAYAAWTAAIVRSTGDVTEVQRQRARHAGWAGVLVGAVIALAGARLPTYGREVLAWAGCIGLVIAIRRVPALVRDRALAAALAPIAALGIVAFTERIPTYVPLDTVEESPARIRDAVLEQLPETADPLVRVSLPAAPFPFSVSTAWAAGLGSINGLYYPPRRFLDLMSALEKVPIASTTCNFEMERSPLFPAWQQLYDIVARVSLAHGDHSLFGLPPPAGPAWFPARVIVVPDAAAIGDALRAALAAGTIHDAVTGTAWLVRDEPIPAPRTPVDPACARAVVRHVDAVFDAQTVTLDVEVPADCVLVVSANYASILHATARGPGEPRAAAVFPIDIALTGIAVPAGTTTVTLAPQVDVPTWSTVLALLGALLLTAAIVDAVRRR